ncbi:MULTISPECIES: Uma2 family endonuclease [Pseudanabaena]|jgi:Uma2 family endonuclease|uniref:Uma2 family endonuclease n=1 Tax=Pseudanabaena TaxID=1152 RepID=UPI00247B2C3E|nr:MULTISPECIES: Uma2 family endonuclease [Pseudanabaena]MEA5485352.1 Uma2 family endonuclease [Pseudanabaena sp. CCNP1317]WGS73572.1 Uma2 family endonuclease [Pseudanabaena galeata CCNP1313]
MVSQLSQKQLAQPEITYPESDGKPMADNTKQFRWILTIQQNIDWLYANDPQVFVAGDLLWYPVEGQTQIAAAPDTMVVFGRPKGDRGSYKQWEEANIAPQVVFEILSPSNKSVEMAKKLIFYDRYGVEEYYIYNPTNNNLEVLIRNAGSLDTIPESHDWVSPRLGIRFNLTDELQIYRPDGTKFYSYIEINTMLEEECLRANKERLRAEQEFLRAEQEHQRAEQTAVKLDEMEAMLQKYRDRFGELLE